MLKTLNSSYLDPREREYARSGGFDSVVLWAPTMAQLCPGPALTMTDAWGRLDQGVANAHEDKLKTYIAIGSDSPGWANRARAKRVGAKNGKCAPDDLSPTGPWAARYITSVLLRHPHVQGVIIMNEPQFAFGEDTAHYIDCVVQQIKSAAEVWHRLKATPMLLAPALFDWDAGGWDNVWYSTEAVLRGLKGWHPPPGVKMGWAQHCYTGIYKRTEILIRNTLDSLDHFERDWPLYLTECGYQFATERDPAFPDGYHWREVGREVQELRQMHGICAMHDWCRKSGRVAMFSQYLYADSVTSGSGWMSGLVRPDGSLRPIHDEWKKL